MYEDEREPEPPVEYLQNAPGIGPGHTKGPGFVSAAIGRAPGPWGMVARKGPEPLIPNAKPRCIPHQLRDAAARVHSNAN